MGMLIGCCAGCCTGGGCKGACGLGFCGMIFCALLGFAGYFYAYIYFGSEFVRTSSNHGRPPPPLLVPPAQLWMAVVRAALVHVGTRLEEPPHLI